MSTGVKQIKHGFWDPDTRQPYVEVTIRLDHETLEQGKGLGNEFATIIGTEILEALKQ